MLLEVLFRVHANPIEHLGRRSLDRLQAFETGYLLSQPEDARDYPFGRDFRQWVIQIYRPSSDVSAKNAYQVLQEVAPDEERAFDLFFEQLKAALAAHSDVLSNPNPLKGRGGEAPLSVSGFLEVLTNRPNMFLPKLAPGCLRAFLDGVRLASVEDGHFECADLDGFEHWVRRKLGLKGIFRWENAVLASFNQAEKEAFDWSLQELKAYRASLGPLSERKYEVEILRAGSDTAGPSAQSAPN